MERAVGNFFLLPSLFLPLFANQTDNKKKKEESLALLPFRISYPTLIRLFFKK